MGNVKPKSGDWVQKVNHGSNVHLVDTIRKDEYGAKVTMHCGGSWYSGVLVKVGENEAYQRPCSKCLEKIDG